MIKCPRTHFLKVLVTRQVQSHRRRFYHLPHFGSLLTGEGGGREEGENLLELSSSLRVFLYDYMKSWLFCCYTWSNWASSPLWRDFDSGLSCDHKKKNYMGQKYSPVLLDLTSTFHWHNNQRGKKYLFEIWHTNITDRLLTEIKRRFQNHYYTPQLEGALWLVSLEDCISLYSLLNSKPLDSFSQSVLYIKETHLFCSDLWLKTWFITYSTNLYLGYQKVFMTPLSRKG